MIAVNLFLYEVRSLTQVCLGGNDVDISWLYVCYDVHVPDRPYCSFVVIVVVYFLFLILCINLLKYLHKENIIVD